VTDGNSVFLSALEVIHRHISIGRPPCPAAVVVAIGYPIATDSKFLFSERRSKDLTLPSPGAGENEGGAEELLDFIENLVKPFIHNRLQETGAIGIGKEALYGHSYGGLFSLHCLYTRPKLFDFYIASSPSIWWNSKYIVTEEAAFLAATDAAAASKPSLLFFGGNLEQDAVRYPKETDADFERRRKWSLEARMVDNATEAYQRLSKSNKFEKVSFQLYDGEDHASVIACSLSQGLIRFLQSL
jgi:predicted alpha/beta superfamily hydrolase